MVAFNAAHGLIAGITGASAIGGMAIGMACPGREWARWIQSTVIPFAAGFGIGAMVGYKSFRWKYDIPDPQYVREVDLVEYEHENQRYKGRRYKIVFGDRNCKMEKRITAITLQGGPPGNYDRSMRKLLADVADIPVDRIV